MKLFRFFLNKYILAATAFAMLMLFFDQNNWPEMQSKRSEIAQNEKTIAYLQADNARMRQEVKELRTDSKTLERYAREHYRMKRDGEDLYVVPEAATAGAESN